MVDCFPFTVCVHLKKLQVKVVGNNKVTLTLKLIQYVLNDPVFRNTGQT